MKKFKKIMAVLVAAIMVVAMTVPAWALDKTGRYPGTTGTININNAEDGETYKAYQIFTLLSFADDNVGTGSDAHATDRYSYALKNDSAWKDFFDADKKASAPATYTAAGFTEWGSDFIDVDKDHPITVKNGATTETYWPVKMNATFEAYTDEDERSEWINPETSSTTQRFAQAALKFAETTSVPETQKKENVSSSNGAAHDQDDGTMIISFTSLPLGYYLVSTTMGSFCALDTTNESVTMIEKNSKPEVSKLVLDNQYTTDTAKRSADGVYASKNTWFVPETDYSVGDTMKFLITITSKKGAKNYKLHDVAELGFDVRKDTIAVYYTDPASTSKMKQAESGENKDYVLTPSPSDGCDFEIVFNNTFLATLTDNALIEVEYTAELMEEAYIFGNTEVAEGNATNILPIEGDPATLTATEVPNRARDRFVDSANTNGAILSYGAGSSTQWADATVNTYQFDLVKTKEGDSNLYDLLATAKFRLFEEDQVEGSTVKTLKAGATPIKFVTTSLSPDAKADSYVVADSKSVVTADNAIIETGTKKVNFRGLKPGVYYLEEYLAPFGYDQISGLVKVTINDDTTPANEGLINILLPGLNGSETEDTLQNPLGTINDDNKYTGAGGVQVINKTSKELPSTGGMGTTVLYIVGGMLVILAGAYLFFSRKKTA